MYYSKNFWEMMIIFFDRVAIILKMQAHFLDEEDEKTLNIKVNSPSQINIKLLGTEIMFLIYLARFFFN